MSCSPCLSVNFILGFTRLIPSEAIPVNVAMSRVECAAVCFEDIRCNSYFYNTHDRYCYLSNTLKDKTYHRGDLVEALSGRYYIIDKARGCKADNGYDFSRLSDKCFKYYSETKIWTDAQQECVLAGANLISIHDDSTRDLMRSLISHGVVWIGLNDRTSERSWVWADGSALTSNYWKPGEPLTSRDSNCASYDPHKNGGWDDVRCSNKYRFVCEYLLM